MWNNPSSIPTNWGICNGSTYGSIISPNLTDNFIRAGTTGNVNNTGGSPTISVSQLPAHTHPVNVSVNDGLHTHGTNLFYGYGGDDEVTNYFQPLGGINPAPHNQMINTTQESSNITVTATTTSTGSGTDYFPPYYRLIFIIKYQ